MSDGALAGLAADEPAVEEGELGEPAAEERPVERPAVEVGDLGPVGRDRAPAPEAVARAELAPLLVVVAVVSTVRLIVEVVS